MITRINSIALFLLGIGSAGAHQMFWSQTRLVHSLSLLNNQLSLRWGIADANTIVFELTAAALGYIGFGLSPNGGMAGSDIILMWVDDATGRTFVQDRSATNNTEPSIDKDQSSIVDFTGTQNSTHTIVRFARKMEAGCGNRNIDTNSQRIIFSYSDKDPENGHAQYHGPIRRGTMSAYLLDDASGEYEQDKQAVARDVTNVWRFVAQDFQIPARITTYQNTFFQLPQIKQDTQILAFEGIADPPNTRYIHHMNVRACNRDFIGTLETTRAHNWLALHPNETKAHVASFNCTTYWFVWNLGGSNLYMPRDAGSKLTARDSKRWVIVEIHYNNPASIAGIRDNSGIQFLVRDMLPLRLHDAGITGVFTLPAVELIIPSHQVQQFPSIGVFTTECTNKFVPASGVRAFAAHLHAHTAGRSIILRHYRNGRELSPILADSNYDLNYQEWRPINVTIFRGDLLLIECSYTTADRNTTTFGGQSTSDEMCFAELYTTPPMSTRWCTSATPRKTIIDALFNAGEQNALGFQFGPNHTPNLRAIFEGKFNATLYGEQKKTLTDALSNYTWTDAATSALRNIYTQSDKQFYCFNDENPNDYVSGVHATASYWTPSKPSYNSC